MANTRYWALREEATHGLRRLEEFAEQLSTTPSHLHAPFSTSHQLWHWTDLFVGQSHNLTNLAETSPSRKERRVFCQVNKQKQALQWFSTSANPRKMVEPHLWEQENSEEKENSGSMRRNYTFPFWEQQAVNHSLNYIISQLLQAEIMLHNLFNYSSFVTS